MRVATYGTGGQARINTGSANGFYAGHWGSTLSHVAIMDLWFTADTNDGSADIGGIGFYGAWSDVLIENCRVERYRMNMVFQGAEAPGSLPLPIAEMSNIRVRRTVSADSITSTGGHSQGIICIGVDGLLIEDSVFDHNGYGPDGSPNSVLLYGSNLYLQISCVNVTTRGNIIARGAGMGLMQRCGGLAENNALLQNPVNINYGYSTVPLYIGGTIRNNVVLDSRDIDADNPRGGGLSLVYTQGLVVQDNIIAHQKGGTENALGIDFRAPFQGATVTGNIVYDWQLPAGSTDKGSCISIGGPPIVGSLTVWGNDFQQPGDFPLGMGALPTLVNFSNNKYWTSGQFWWGVSGSQWVNATGEGSGAIQQRSYPEPWRDINTYAGLAGVNGLDGFMTEARKQSRDNWRSGFTAQGLGDYIRAGFGRGTIPPTCYANCDGSTASPVLNAADFTCFLQKYAAGDSYANCDGSRVAPVINAADFTCFLHKYAAGCP
jgi:hypothetical protein